MNTDAKRENMRALANSLGISEEEAGIKLGFEVKLFYSENITGSKQFSQELYNLLSRTVETVTCHKSETVCFSEIKILGNTDKTLYVYTNNNAFIINTKEIESHKTEKFSHPLFLLLCACYTSASIMKLAVDNIPFAVKFPMLFNLNEIINPDLLYKPINLKKTYMAGAGAIGNTLLWAFRHLDVRGELHICDDDKVGSGNLNRQLFFAEEDIGKYKAEQLVKKAQPFMTNLKLISRPFLLQNLNEAGNGFWLERLISAVDSRRARRTLQGEFPREIFDSSTTDVSEIVIHYHKQPTNTACMTCIYSEDDRERSHEMNIAESLGVEISEVKKERINYEMAEIISKRFSDANIDSSAIEGEAYDSLYKALCGQGKLKNVENGQILAPFCFVSALAGVMLAIEIVKRLADNKNMHNYNFWKISAWHPPYPKIKKTLQRKDNCPSCGSKTIQTLIKEKWGN